MRATPYTPFFKLRRRMNEIHMTQGELAKRIGRSEPYVRNRFIRSGWFILDECYRILSEIGVKDTELADYFPRNGGIEC